MSKPNFAELANSERKFNKPERRLHGAVPCIALTPVVDGRDGAYEDNLDLTWKMVEKVYNLISENIFLPDGTPVKLVVAPEIVYGAKSGARAQEYYTKEGVAANIWISRSWAYSDELMSACQGIGSSEWIQAAYGLNQTNRPGAVWLKAFCAAMDEKERPVFSIYNPDLEDENGSLAPYVAERLLRFARCATAVLEMRGKNYMSLGGVSMGIIGSDVRRNSLLHYFGMGSVSLDMTSLKGRMDNGFYDHDELEKAFKFMKKFSYKFNKGKKPLSDDELLRQSIIMTMITRDLMVGNEKLADSYTGRKQGFKADVEFSQGHNAIVGGTQGQRAWTDLYPNFDMTESLLNSSFDWNGFRTPFITATENDSKNGLGMLAAHLITGLPQLFADIRTNWTPESIKKVTGEDVSNLVANGLIDKRNSGAASLDYSLNLFELTGTSPKSHPSEIAAKIQNNSKLKKELIEKAISNTTYMGAVIEYFRGDGLSSSFRTPGKIPLTSYRYNVVGDKLSCSIAEGETVELPEKVADHIGAITNETWPETFWTPYKMSSFEYMSRIGPNHDGSSFGLIGADLITLNSMLRIPVDMNNIDKHDIFRPTIWDRYGGDDYRTCEKLGPLYR